MFHSIKRNLIAKEKFPYRAAAGPRLLAPVVNSRARNCPAIACDESVEASSTTMHSSGEIDEAANALRHPANVAAQL